MPASVNLRPTDNNSILLVELMGTNWQISSQQNPPLVESFYIKTDNFLASICQKPNCKLIYIGDQKANPEDFIKITAIG